VYNVQRGTMRLDLEDDKGKEHSILGSYYVPDWAQVAKDNRYLVRYGGGIKESILASFRCSRL
jgi:hypothetical protein